MIKFADMALNLEYFFDFLIYGADYPGLTLALDPFTIALIASAAAKGYKAYKSIDEGSDMMSEGEKSYDEYSKKLMDIASQERELAQGHYDLEQATRQATEYQRKSMEDIAKRAEGTLLRNIDPRTAPSVAENISKLQQGTSQNLGALAGQDLAARSSLLAKEQAVADENFMRKFGMEKYLYGTEQQRAAASAEAGRQQKLLGEQQMIDIIPQALGTYANLEASGLMGGGSGTKTTKDTDRYGFGYTLGGGNSPFASNANTGLNYNNPLTTGLRKNYDGSIDFNNNPFDSLKEGGVLKAEKGTAMMTPGEFSHETNPQNVRASGGDLVFEDKEGEPFAEVTGGEIVLTQNGEEEGAVVIAPKDQVSIQELIDKGDKDGLFEHLKDLLKKFKEKAEAHENNEMQQ